MARWCRRAAASRRGGRRALRALLAADALWLGDGGALLRHIKELSSGTWYKFNDSHVTTVSAEQLRAAMGGDGAGTWPTAYMCLLRRVDASRRP